MGFVDRPGFSRLFFLPVLPVLIGRVLFVGLAFALWLALLPVCTIYGFIWLARL